MKVIGINGSARKGGNTAEMIKRALAELETEGIETELVELGGKKLHGCIACMKCFKNKDRRCSVDNDFMNEVIAKMDEADGMILGSPTYFANVSTEMKAVIDRAGMVARAPTATCFAARREPLSWSTVAPVRSRPSTPSTPCFSSAR